MPLNFFTWGYSKDKVYTRKLTTMEELKAMSEQECTPTSNEMFVEVCESIAHRYQ